MTTDRPADAAVGERSALSGDSDSARDSAGESASRRASRRAVVAWIVGAFALRTMLATFVPLLPDETYYWEWSRRLAPGYFDHPPGVALLIRLGTLLFGDTTPGVRTGPALAALVTHVAATALAWRLAGGRHGGLHAANAAVRAAALVALLPIATLGLVLATPDAALFASGMVALVCVERALASPLRSGTSTRWWALAGVALGAAFVAKYTAVLLPMGLVIACLVHPSLRRRFAEPGPWIASAIALLLFAPVVLWNATNDWVSFRFQLGHGFNAVSRGNPFTREVELLGGQLGLASPLLFVLLGTAVWTAMREGWRGRDDVDALLVATGEPATTAARRFALAVVALVPLVFFAISASRRPVEANWPALIYPGAMALLATTTASWAHGRAWRTGVGVAAFLLLVLTVQAWRPVLPLAPRKDPIARAHGWASLAAAVDSARRDAFVAGVRTVWIAADRYQDASELAFHLHDQPRVFSLNVGGRRNHYDLWPTAYDLVKPGDAMVAAFDANPQGDTVAVRVGAWFAEAKQGPTIALRRGAGEVAHRKIWLYRGARVLPPEPARFRREASR